MSGRRIAIAAGVAAVAGYYWWAVQAGGHRFDFGAKHEGYYNYLGRAFATGELALPLRPKAELLALPNPYDPGIDPSLRMQDMALYRGRYYLYHGAGPAALMFGPYYWLTGRDLPERFALLLFCLGGFLFSAALLLRLLAIAQVRPAPWLLAATLIALGITPCLPYLMNRVWVYELAIGGAYCFVAGGFYCLLRGMTAREGWGWFAGAGFCFGLAMACRPHMVLVAMLVLAVLAVRRRPAVAAYTVPIVVIGALLAGYNYARFGDAAEFGVRYLMAGPNQNRVVVESRYVPFGLYYLLQCPVDVSPVFPWIRLAEYYPFGESRPVFPPAYFVEPTAGALWLAPFLPLGLLLFRFRGLTRLMMGVLIAAAAGLLLFLAATGWSTQRYEVDFLPWAVLPALAVLLSLRRSWLGVPLLAWGVAVNVAIGLSGPYDEFLKEHPAEWVQMAEQMSAADEYVPLLNPAMDVRFRLDGLPCRKARREPLFTAGHRSHRYCLYAERSGADEIALVSDAGGKIVRRAVPVDGTVSHGYRVRYDPAIRRLTVTVDGVEQIVHDGVTLVTAPVQVTPGENRTDAKLYDRRFSGRIAVEQMLIRKGSG